MIDSQGKVVFRAEILAVPARRSKEENRLVTVVGPLGAPASSVQGILFHAAIVGSDHVLGEARADASLKVKPTLREETRLRGEAAFGALDQEGRKAKEGSCPEGYAARPRRGSKAATATDQSPSGGPGQGGHSNPEEAKDAAKCMESIRDAVMVECRDDQDCRSRRLKQLGYEDFQLRPVFQQGGPGMLAPKPRGPAGQVGGGGEEYECVREDENGSQGDGAAYKSEGNEHTTDRRQEGNDDEPGRENAPGREQRPASDLRPAAVNELLQGATLEKDKYSNNYRKPGGFGEANKDFDALTRGAPVKDHGNGVRSSTLPDGSTVSVRPKSSPGANGLGSRPTVQIDSAGSSKKIKVRYGP